MASRGARRWNWAFRIVSNIAKTRGLKGVPQRAVLVDGEEGPAVDPDRFRTARDRYPGHWQTPPEPSEQRLEEAETRDAALAAIATLLPRQREIITLRDIAGFSAEEACNTLDVTETNQRVLLHRARSKVRNALESHVNAAETDETQTPQEAPGGHTTSSLPTTSRSAKPA